MPSLYAHKMIADKVFDKLEKPSYIKNNYNEFLLGSIGLEMFNYHRLFKMLQSSHLEQLGSVLKYINHVITSYSIHYTKLYEDMINEIYIYGGEYTTSRGIGIGATLDEVKAAYGDTGFQEGNSYVYVRNNFV